MTFAPSKSNALLDGSEGKGGADLQLPVPASKCVLEYANAHFSFRGVVVSTLSPAKYIAIASAVVASRTPSQATCPEQCLHLSAQRSMLCVLLQD